MAKQAKANKVEVAPQEQVVVKTAAPVKPTKPTWEIKDRIYFLKGTNHAKIKNSKFTYAVQIF